jgi:hypothetical protein
LDELIQLEEKRRMAEEFLFLLNGFLLLWSGPRPGGLALRLRDSWGTEVRGWSFLALGGVG